MDEGGGNEAGHGTEDYAGEGKRNASTAVRKLARGWGGDALTDRGRVW